MAVSGSHHVNFAQTDTTIDTTSTTWFINRQLFMGIIKIQFKIRIVVTALSWKKREGAPGVEPGTWWSAVTRSNHWAIHPWEMLNKRNVGTTKWTMANIYLSKIRLWKSALKNKECDFNWHRFVIIWWKTNCILWRYLKKAKLKDWKFKKRVYIFANKTVRE